MTILKALHVKQTDPVCQEKKENDLSALNIA